MKNINRKLLCTLLSFLIVISIASCSSGTNKTANVMKHNSATGNEIVADTAYAAGDTGTGSYATANEAIDAEVMNEGELISYEGESGEVPDIPAGNMLIRTVSLSMNTENFDTVAEQIRTAVNEYGGYFENMSISGTGTEHDYKSGTFVIRVPADNLDALTASLDGSGTVISASESTEDVTLDYVDIESHLSALRTEQESLMALLEEADDIETIVQLEGYLTDIRYEIECYESQARTINNLVQYATLTINLHEVVKEEEPVEIEEIRDESLKTKMSKEFNESMKEIKEGAKDLMVRFAGDLPHMTVRLFVLAIFAFIGVSTFKIIKKRKAKKAITQAPEKPSSDKS